MRNSKKRAIELSVVLPCRDEEAAIGMCIAQIKTVFITNGITGEIIVSDSSKDRSPRIARSLGARVIKHDQEGYGRAYLEGFRHAKGEYIFCADPDGSYDFKEIPRFIQYLQKNSSDFVLGNRFGGKMAPGSMPFLHRYIGQPLFSFLFALLFDAKLPDVHSGMRALHRDSLLSLDLRSPGMEFASEMLIKALERNMRIRVLAIHYHPRLGTSKLRTFRDGWRHIAYMFWKRVFAYDP